MPTRGFVSAYLSGAEIGSSQFAKFRPQMQFEPTENVINAPFTILSVVGYNQIEQLVERCSFDGGAAERSGRDLAQSFP
jgi:hypothetical protein